MKNEYCFVIMQYSPFLYEKDIQEQWTMNKCISFLRRKGYIDLRRKRVPAQFVDETHLLYVDPYTWVDLEFESDPKEGRFRILFYNIIFY